MATLNPLICGQWNGHNLWLQWTPVGAADGQAPSAAPTYRVEIALRGKEGDAVRWMLLDGGRTKSCWKAIAAWRQGAIAQARVAVNGSDEKADPVWETAVECVFTRSSCLFHFQAAAERPLSYAAKTTFHCFVDGAACHYFNDLPIEVPAGQTVPATLQSLQSGAFNQLDAAEDFVLTPESGVRIWNVEPSRNDVRATGRDFTVLSILPADGPAAVVFLSRGRDIR